MQRLVSILDEGGITKTRLALAISVRGARLRLLEIRTSYGPTPCRINLVAEPIQAFDGNDAPLVQAVMLEESSDPGAFSEEASRAAVAAASGNIGLHGFRQPIHDQGELLAGPLLRAGCPKAFLREEIMVARDVEVVVPEVAAGKRDKSFAIARFNTQS